MRTICLAVSVAGLLACLMTAAPAANDRLGDPLPEGAVQRLGTLRMRYGGGISDLCYMLDGRGLIAVGGRVETWDLAKGELQATQQVCKASIRSMVLRSDGQAILVAESAGNVREWDLVNQRELRSWATKQSSLRCAHYSPDEKRVLTTGSKPPTLKEWELESGKELVAVTGKMHYFHEAIYGPEGKTAIVDGGAGSGPCLAHYDLATGELLHEWLKDYYTHSRSIVLSEDRERLLIGSRHSATEWLLDGYEQLKKFSGHHGHAVTAAAYCKEPDQLLTGSRDGSIRRWNRLEGKVLLRWCPHDAHVTRIQVSPDGKWVLSYGGRMVAETSMATGEVRASFERHNGPVAAVAALASGNAAVSGSTDGTLRTWDIASGGCLATVQGANLGAYAVAASTDGNRVAAGCKDGVIREFTLPDGELIRELSGHRGYVRSLVYAPAGDRLVSSGGDGGIWVWGMAQDEPLQVLKGHRGGALSVAVSADGKSALSGGRDGTVRYWDLQKGSLLQTCKGHRGWVHAVAFAGDSGHGLSAARDGKIIKWDLATGEVLAEMANGAWVYALACAADGKTACAGGSDDKITCWDLAKGEKIATFAGHKGDILSLALTPDGERLISASQDTTLLVWEMSSR